MAVRSKALRRPNRKEWKEKGEEERTQENEMVRYLMVAASTERRRGEGRRVKSGTASQS